MGNRWALAVAAAGLLATASGCMPVLREQQAVDHYVRGQVLADQGDANAAIAELAEAVRQNPKLSVAHAAIGDLYRRQGNLDQARQSYETACQTDPYALRPHYNLAVTYQMLSQAAKAVAKTQQYLREAVRIYLRAVAIEPNDFDSNLNLAACYFQLGKFDLAEQYAQAAIKANPASPQAHSNLGVIYDSQGRSFDAIREFKASLEIDAHQPQLLLNLGATYAKQDRLKIAITCFELAAKEDPNFAPAYEQMGACYFQLRQYEKAMSSYERAIAVDGNSAAAYRGIGAAYMSQYVTDRSKEELREKALDAWHRSLELKSDQQDLLKLVEKYRPRSSAPEL
jgi:tetratricopeptide (TPR) repeat protein